MFPLKMTLVVPMCYPMPAGIGAAPIYPIFRSWFGGPTSSGQAFLTHIIITWLLECSIAQRRVHFNPLIYGSTRKLSPAPLPSLPTCGVRHPQVPNIGVYPVRVFYRGGLTWDLRPQLEYPLICIIVNCYNTYLLAYIIDIS